jgi:hypothetical protein
MATVMSADPLASRPYLCCTVARRRPAAQLGRQLQEELRTVSGE